MCMCLPACDLMLVWTGKAGKAHLLDSPLNPYCVNYIVQDSLAYEGKPCYV